MILRKYCIIPALVGLFIVASCAPMAVKGEGVESPVVRVEVVNPNVVLNVDDPTRMYVSVVNLTDETLDGLEFSVRMHPTYQIDLSYLGGDIDPIPPRGSWSPPGGVGIRARVTGRVVITFEVQRDGVPLAKDIAYVRIAPDPFYE
ncbi:MAG: hypothetical protein JW885_14915 [Deltaproteobacteria bacterium]|nr:hypothetical protein [Candidatus Zymogenaceae bacterium]